jgi:proline iminopeptidase
MQPQLAFTVHGGAGPIAGWIQGSGEPVVLLHGGPGLADYLGPLADELVDGYQVVRYQQRGLPPSTTCGPFTIESHVDDALAVLDHTSNDPVLVVGHSWGGHLAMHLAIRHPGRLRGMVIVDPLGAVGDGGEADMFKSMAQRIPPEQMARAQELDETAMRGEGKTEDAIESLRLLWPGYFADPNHPPPMPRMDLSLPCSAQTWESIHSHLNGRTLEEALPSIRVPCVFVLGGASPIPPRHGEATAALLTGASVVVVEGCGHFPWLERAGVVRLALDRIAKE